METQIGDLLKSDCDIILQQLNCLCICPHGLSQSIAKKFPYADVYRKRKPIGTRNLSVPENRGTPGRITISKGNGPIVIGLYGQYDFGRAYRKGSRPQWEGVETNEQRVKWFQKCLRNLEKWLSFNNMNCENITIGVPFGIGCGLAGGDWSVYSEMLNRFTDKVKCKVIMFRLK